ncbi:hypothetical protein QTP88_026293 [Uroleucon formosanum]
MGYLKPQGQPHSSHPLNDFNFFSNIENLVEISNGTRWLTDLAFMNNHTKIPLNTNIIINRFVKFKHRICLIFFNSYPK